MPDDPSRQYTAAEVRALVSQALTVPDIPPYLSPQGYSQPVAPVLYDPQGFPIRQLFTGPTGWMPVGEPMRTVAPRGTPARQWETPISINRIVQPRGTEPIGFYELRALSRRATIVRLAIETCKDIPEAYGWQVVGKPGRNVKDSDSRIDEVQSFLEQADRRTSFNRFMRKVREDYLGIDAPTVLVDRTRKGDPYAFLPVDGASIHPLCDITGRTPLAGPAYDQVLYGVKVAEFTIRDLCYMPRNPSSDRLYGYPPTEQLMIVAAGIMARELRQLLYNSEGNVPDVFLRVPKDWTQTQIQNAQLWFDQRKGDLAARTGMLLVPESGIQEMHEPPQKVEIDEWWARYVCWAYSLSPLVFLRQGMNRACHSDDTEVLTEQGWRRFPELARDEKIATFNPKTHALEYHPALKHYAYPYTGPMVRYLTKGVDVLVTPEHEMWGRPRGASGAYGKFPAARPPVEQLAFVASAQFDGPERSTFTLPGFISESKFAWPREWPDVPVPMDDWLEFLGYYLSEGGLSHAPKHYLLTLSQKSPANAAKIDACLARLPFSWTRYPAQPDGMHRWNVYGRPLCDWLRTHVGGYSHDKRIPRSLLGLSARQLRILFDAYMLGDGSWDTREGCQSGYCATSSRQLADDVQELAFKLGYSAAQGPVRQDTRPNRRPLYRVTLAVREEHTLRTTTWISPDGGTVVPGALHADVPYSGTVYCVEVPHHLFVTRRNGKIAIHGNTGKVLQDTALDEGLIPRQKYESEFLERLITIAWGWTDLTVAWTEARDSDPQVAAQIAQIHVDTGIKTRNEARDDLGLDPIAGGDIATVKVGNQLITLEDLAAGKYTPLDPAELERIAQEAKAKVGAAAPASTNGDGKPAKPDGATPVAAAPARGEKPAASGEAPLRKRARRTVATIPKRQRPFWRAARGTPPPRARPSDDWRGT